jgi:ribonuclease G
MLEASKETPSGSDRRGQRRRGGPELAKGFRCAEVYFERRGNRSIVGNIYKGVVDNVLPGLEAAFVDIGLDKNGFLHVDEIVLPGVERVQRGRGDRGSRGQSIVDLLKPGQEVVCQVVKDPLKTKGARLSMEVTIAGRYMVYAPTGEGVGVSRRLDDKERARLRKEAAKLDLGGGGAIIRTAAHGAKREDFERELLYLHKLNDVLNQRVADTRAPNLVFQEADLAIRVVRDIFSADFERAVVDDPKQYHRMVSFFSRTAPELVDRVELWETDEPLLDAYGVDDVIEGMLGKRVDLPSGGYLLIDYAEALTVIDVNTGSFIGRGKGARLEDTITKTNLEAADEVVNQLRLRDIGGIIVIDFIDMARARNRDAVLKTLRKALDEDRTKTFTAEISPLGLVEMTRQNVTEGVREIMTKHCPTCGGEGVVRSEETVAIEVERKLREQVKADGPDGPEAYLVRLNSRVTEEFIADGARMLHDLETETGRYFSFEGSEGLPVDHYAITMTGSREDVTAAAVPFAEGDEVHVKIVEPHMFTAGDAVAKVDGYIIEVVDGGPFVGEKRMVRIEAPGRTSARAVLVDVTEEELEKIKADREAEERRAKRAPRAPAKKKAAPRAAPAKADKASDEDSAAEEKPKRRRTRAKKAEEEPSEAAVDEAGAPAAEEDGDGDALESRPRRRGRRGGRRRSRAKGDEAPAAESTEANE